jgi:hypothetical protein
MSWGLHEFRNSDTSMMKALLLNTRIPTSRRFPETNTHDPLGPG